MKEKNRMKHKYYEMLISAERDNEITAEEALELAKHRFNCEKCSGFKKDIASLSNLLQGQTMHTSLPSKPIIYRLSKYIISAAAAVIFAFGVSLVWRAGNFNEESKLASDEIEAAILAVTESAGSEFESLVDYDADAPLALYLKHSFEYEDDSDILPANNNAPMSSFLSYFDDVED